MTEAERLAFIAVETRLTAPPLVPEIVLHLATSALPLWQATEDALAERGVPPPYWAFAWPGGIALARYLLDHAPQVAGRRVIDFGAGSGLAAIAACRSGAASCVAVERDALARTAIAMNAAANAVGLIVSADDVMARPCATDLLLLGDLCYERQLAEHVMAWARTAAAAGVAVLLADPGRNYSPVAGLTERARYTVPTLLDLEDQISRETVVWQVTGTSA